MNEKRSEFLWLVQMIMIKHQEGIDGWSGVAGDAVAASHRIPVGMTVRTAALAFCSVFIPGFAGEERTEVPGWMIDLSDPSGSAYEGEGSLPV